MRVIQSAPMPTLARAPSTDVVPCDTIRKTASRNPKPAARAMGFIMTETPITA
jgi:hypothetical protein